MKPTTKSIRRRDQRRSFKLTSYQEALNRVLSSINDEVPSCEEIYAHDSVGRVLAQDITSEKNIPERDKAVYDGYLIHSEDIKNAS